MCSMDTGERNEVRKRRAERRMQRQRVVRHAVRIATLFGIPAGHAETWAKHNADNLKPCSCWMCGHARRWWGAPCREKRWALTDDE